MRTPVDLLEPAVRDPRKLRRTAFWLFVIMIASGVGVFSAYMKWAAKQADDDRPGFVGRIDNKSEFGVVRQDESGAKLSELFGKVWVVCGVSVKQPESWQATREVLLRLNQRYAGREDFRIVCFTVDPGQEDPAVLAAAAAGLGVGLPNWWFAAAGEEYVHKFLKNKLRLGLMPHQVDGKWIYDASLVVVDRDRHIRQASLKQGKYRRNKITFDFEQAAKWDAEGRTVGLEKSNSETLESLLVKTVDELLAKPVTP
jgi:cytochrome oxidase Cu insertion factor (SCO1/SenC/PrrC family)